MEGKTRFLDMVMALKFLLSLLLLQSPDSVLTAIGIDQKLDTVVDPTTSFRDETGESVTLRDYLGKRPIILTPVYYECPMLCSMQLNGLVKAMRVMPFTAGKEFQIVTFSIDPKETPELALEKKRHYVRDYGRTGADTGWHFLTGTPESIHKLTDEIGFRYMYDNYTSQWAHASGLVILTPDGRVSQYFYGIEYDPGALKYSLIEASNEKIGSLVDHVLMYCFQYNATTGRYSLAIMRVVRAAGVATVLALVSFMVIGARRKRLA
jgi:protein SCO1/2